MQRIIKVVGTSRLTQEQKEKLEFILPGDIVDLVHDERNRYDPHAISVRYQNTHIAYIPNSDLYGRFADELYPYVKNNKFQAMVYKIWGGIGKKENIGFSIIVEY